MGPSPERGGSGLMSSQKEKTVWAISIRQPWAELILRREKLVEFRLWRLPKKYCHQWLWLHVAAAMSGKEREIARRIFGPFVLPLGGFVGRIRFGLPTWNYTPEEGKPYINRPCCWYWPITEVERADFIPAKGRLRIFTVEISGESVLS